jgi:hypothetical protein
MEEAEEGGGLVVGPGAGAQSWAPGDVIGGGIISPPMPPPPGMGGVPTEGDGGK